MQEREQLRLEVRQRLASALREFIPGQRMLLFGSVTRPCKFHVRSDVDVALLEPPKHCSIFRLQAQLEEAVRRPVDLILLEECRFQEKIRTEGELWTS
jgi:uncharacterized protein